MPPFTQRTPLSPPVGSIGLPGERARCPLCVCSLSNSRQVQCNFRNFKIRRVHVPPPPGTFWPTASAMRAAAASALGAARSSLPAAAMTAVGTDRDGAGIGRAAAAERPGQHLQHLGPDDSSGRVARSAVQWQWPDRRTASGVSWWHVPAELVARGQHFVPRFDAAAPRSHPTGPQ